MKTRNQNYLVVLVLLPVLRYLNEYAPTLVTLLGVGICLYFLLRGLRLHLMESEKGRAFLRRMPFLKVPEEDAP